MYADSVCFRLVQKLSVLFVHTMEIQTSISKINLINSTIGESGFLTNQMSNLNFTYFKIVSKIELNLLSLLIDFLKLIVIQLHLELYQIVFNCHTNLYEAHIQKGNAFLKKILSINPILLFPFLQYFTFFTIFTLCLLN